MDLVYKEGMARRAQSLLLVSLAALALAVASTASASTFVLPANEEFKITSRPDGTGNKAHHLFLFQYVGYFTCGGIGTQGLANGKEASQLLLEVAYSECLLQGVPATVQMGGCAYLFDADGTFEITNRPGKNCAAEPITINANCQITLGPQKHEGAITYTNVSGGPVSEVTASLAFEELTGEQAGIWCEARSFADTVYATGRLILKAAKAANPLEAVNLSWK
jgi:hypothetical protein